MLDPFVVIFFDALLKLLLADHIADVLVYESFTDSAGTGKLQDDEERGNGLTA
jgi:hypothetical protein